MTEPSHVTEPTQDFTMWLHQITNRLIGLFSRRIKAPLALRLLRGAWEVVKLVLALAYLVLDELGFLIKWLTRHVKPLELYFNAIKRLAFVLRTRGLGSPDPIARQITPYLALPFVLFPISLLLPAKIYFLHLILQRPIYAIPALLLAKLFSAIFVKHTWDILRCVGRRNERIRRIDDKWLALEHWAKATIEGVARWLAATPGFIWAKEVSMEVADEARPLIVRVMKQTRASLARVLAQARAWLELR